MTAFPVSTFSDLDPDAFASKDQVAEYFEAYAEQIDAPIRCGVEVLSVRRNEGRATFRAETTDGTIEARYVVAATGPFQRPRDTADPARRRTGRADCTRAPTAIRVSCPTAPCSSSEPDRPACRSQMNCWARAGASICRSALTTVPHAATAGVTSSGGSACSANGTPRPHRWEQSTSRSRSVGHMAAPPSTFATWLRAAWCSSAGPRLATAKPSASTTDLGENIAHGDATYLSLLDEADAYVTDAGLDFPEEPEARELGPLPPGAVEPLRELDLADAGVTSVIWATGFAVDYSWLAGRRFRRDR